MSIHEQNYLRYEGPLRKGGAAWSIARNSLTTYLGMLRTKLILLFLWTMPLITAVLVFIEFTVRRSAQSMGGGVGDALEV